jgi:hypothetical protein
MRVVFIAASAICVATGGISSAAKYVVMERPAPPAQIVDVTASSTAKGDFAAWHAFDGDPTTAWCEGKAGDGKGESITLTFPSEMDVRGVVVRTGFQKNEATFKSHLRPALLEVVGDDAVVHTVNGSKAFDDVVRSEALDLQSTKKITFRFADVDKPAKGASADACISEIQLISDSDTASEMKLVFGIEPDVLSSLPPTVVAFGKALDACDEAGFAQEVSYPVAWVQLGADQKAARKTVFKNAAALAKECKARGKAGGASYAADSFDLNGSIHGVAPGVVSVSASVTPSRWKVAWTDAGWRITEIATYGK